MSRCEPPPNASQEPFTRGADPAPANAALPPLLIVENDPDEVAFFRNVLRKAGTENPLRFAGDGAEAIQLLSNANGEERAHPFRLMFLDLRMPRQNGFDVLNWVRRHRTFDRLVIAILSTSAEDRDVIRAYDMGAQTFLVKYPTPAILRQIVTAVNQLPAGTPASTVKLPGVRPNFRFPAEDYAVLLRSLDQAIQTIERNTGTLSVDAMQIHTRLIATRLEVTRLRLAVDQGRKFAGV
jgi:DNA-binding response OmpR family regulator